MPFYSFELTSDLESRILDFCENQLWNYDDQTGFKQCLKNICFELNQKIPYYDWVGFYWSSEKEERILELWSYVGTPTDHVRIPFGKGICGQVAESCVSMIIGDVSAENNYIACSVDVRSEIVVPIMKNNHFIGQIDVDSHALEAFGVQDQYFLEKICNIISKKIS